MTAAPSYIRREDSNAARCVGLRPSHGLIATAAGPHFPGSWSISRARAPSRDDRSRLRSVHGPRDPGIRPLSFERRPVLVGAGPLPMGIEPAPVGKGPPPLGI